MPVHLLRDVGLLKKDILTLGTMAELAVQEATAAIEARDAARAQRVIDNDIKLDEMEVQVEESCLKILALYQPVATDLRFITSAMGINIELERIGDLAVNISHRALSLNQEPQLKPYIDIPRMAEITKKMVKEALDAFVSGNADLARTVCERDDQVDDLDDQIFRELLSYMLADPKTITRAIHLIIVSKHLERIADHATNIAEGVIFMVKARVIKHHAYCKPEDD